MRQELLEAVAQVVTVHSFWLRVSSLKNHQRYYTRLAGQVSCTTCRCMTLEVIRGRGQYVVGHQWQIPEPELDRAFGEIRSQDDGFRRRCNDCKPSAEDVEQLIRNATHGAIKPELIDEDDFTPIIRKNKN